MADWPSSLPVPLLDGVSYESQENAIRSQFQGVAKLRRRFTAVPEDVTFSLFLDRAQVQTLQDFVAITLGDVLPFQWKEFRKPDGPENVATYRFKTRPRFTPMGSGRTWRADVELELLTTFQGTFLLDIEGLST